MTNISAHVQMKCIHNFIAIGAMLTIISLLIYVQTDITDADEALLEYVKEFSAKDVALPSCSSFDSDPR